MSTLQVEDIQGLLLHGYGALKGARYVALRIVQPGAARAWLSGLSLRDATRKPGAADRCVNVAFTSSGLAQLGLAPDLLAMFSGEFREGMGATPHRQRLLGDLGESAPSEWQWGGPEYPVDLLLMLFAADKAAVSTLYDEHAAKFAAAGVELVKDLPTDWLPDFKEHFGFRDGISQPQIDGWGEDGPPHNRIAAGEFILGYVNGYGQFVERPLLPPARDPRGLLPDAPDHADTRDLGKNGSYMVFRQLSQDVTGFWRFLAGKAPNLQAQIALAAKMVGRWPEGASLVQSPEAPPAEPVADNDFLYYGSGDPHGFKCPLGAHVRRTNPRDSLDPEPGSERSIEVGKRHRILRRGRTYGEPVVADMNIAELAVATENTAPRGLHFICFNTHISRQFEFIQHTWVNSPKFDGLYSEDDPLVGPRNGAGGTFCMQAEPVRKRVTGLPKFVRMRGGGYFFLPGIRAVKYLASVG